MTMTTHEVMTTAPVIPVVTLNSVEEAVPLARALALGGLSVIEVTLRTEAGLPGIAAIARDLPDVIVGAGTVLTPEQANECRDAGSQFLVSPGTTETLMAHFMTMDIGILPGAATSSEVMRLRECGFYRQKFFPAGAAGGASMLKSWSAPIADVAFCPTGGISLDNAKTYLDLPNVLCVGGSWVTPSDAVKEGDWVQIERLARDAREALA